MRSTSERLPRKAGSAGCAVIEIVIMAEDRPHVRESAREGAGDATDAAARAAGATPKKSTIPPPIDRVEPATSPSRSRPQSHLATDVVVLPANKSTAPPTGQRVERYARDARSPSYKPPPGVIARSSTIPPPPSDHADTPMPEPRPARSSAKPPSSIPQAHEHADAPELEPDLDRSALSLPVREPRVESTDANPSETRLVHVESEVSSSLVRMPSVALGTVPTTPSAGRSRARALPTSLDERLVLLTEPDSPRAASFRLLRDNLVAKRLPRVLAVSSAAPHEGKTTCSTNLALALAEQTPTRVLLVEGNFFAGSLADLFAIDAITPSVPKVDFEGLSPYRIVEVARGLHVAAIVRESGEGVARFDSRWFEMVVGHLCGFNYDYVIIDAAALDGSPTVTQIIAIADATLLTVRSGATTARALRRAVQEIPPTRAIGIALVDAERQA
jgi:Mrp family chromosome partitioning ATPase